MNNSVSNSNPKQGRVYSDNNAALGILVTRSTTTLTPTSSIGNHMVAADMHIISPLWSQHVDEEGEDFQSSPISVADPSKYLVDVPIEIHDDSNVGFMAVLNKSMKKRNSKGQLRQLKQKEMLPG